MGTSSQHGLLKEFVGVVVDIIPKYKAIVQFQFENKTERALLKYDKFKLEGERLPDGGSIDEYVEINTQLKFLCHRLDDSGIDRCQWYITCAWKQDPREAQLESSETIVRGVYNCTGHILEVARRQGILSFTNNGKEEIVMFLASKLFVSGKRVSAKTNLLTQAGLEEGRQLCFDAVPCDPANNERQCSWFATVVWKGRKPLMEYDDVRNVRNQKQAKLSVMSEIKLVTSNPHSTFFRGEGQVMKIINAEYGLLLAMIKPNHYETVLFHRNQAMLFDMSLDKADLTTIFQEGDKVRIIAAVAPKKMATRWLASQVRLWVDPSIVHQFQF